MTAAEKIKSLTGTTRRAAEFLLAHENEFFGADELARALGLKRPPYAALGTLVRMGIAEREDADDGRPDKFAAHYDFVNELANEEINEAATKTDQRAIAQAHRMMVRRRSPSRRRETIGCMGWIAVILGATTLIVVCGIIYDAVVSPVGTPPSAPAPKRP